MPEFLARLTVRRDSGPIDSTDTLCRFVATRAAFIAQKTLYGYLKARMGTRYPSMFEDDVFASSIDIAKMHVFAACLSDLTLFAVSHALQDETLDDVLRRELALQCFHKGLADNAAAAAQTSAFSADEAMQAFERRLAFHDWHNGPRGAALFTASPAALFEWAPIAPALKKHDKEIVENSIKFKWRDIRERFEKRARGSAVAADLTSFAELRH
ncbi:hypothetical protein [Pelagibius sp.]|uniref:hypothetical protein n=1 Tax=Pelagibius sp. TaxID=1931238 RepID=UPI0026135464|nr:hypothetical protein [Pelagibius sp.]